MKRRFSFFLLLLFASFATFSSAQTRLKAPLQFVSPDSVVIWGQDLTNLRGAAMSMLVDATPRTVEVTKSQWKNFDVAVNNFKETAAKHFNIVGGADDPFAIPQGAAAAVALYQNASLLLMTGDARRADDMERLVFNALLHTVADTIHPRGTKDRLMASEALLSAPGMMYCTDKEGIYANFFLNSTTRIATEQFSMIVDQNTEMPYGERVKFRFLGLSKKHLPFKFRLRMPLWATRQPGDGQNFCYAGKERTAPTVYVNGHEWEQPMIERGYLVIEREWRSGDEVFVDFPFDVQLLRRLDVEGKAQRGEVALQVGPLVYVCPEKYETAYFSESAAKDIVGKFNDYGVPYLSFNLYDATDVPADASACPVPVIAVPYMLCSTADGTAWWRECK